MFPAYNSHNRFVFNSISASASDLLVPDFEYAQSLDFLDEGYDSTVARINANPGQCLSDYCDSLDGCNHLSYPDTSLYDKYNSLGYYLSSICNSVPKRITSDVGGIGVGISSLRDYSPY